MSKYYYMADCVRRLLQVLDKVEVMNVRQAMCINNNNPLARGAYRKAVFDGYAFFTADKKYIIKQPWRKPNKYVDRAIDVMLAFLPSMNLDTDAIYVSPRLYKDENGKYTRDGVHGNKNRLLLGFTRLTKNYEVYYVNDKDAFENLGDYLNEEYASYLKVNGVEHANNLRYLILVPNDSYFVYQIKNARFPYAYCIRKEGKDQRGFDVVDIDFYIPENGGLANEEFISEFEQNEGEEEGEDGSTPPNSNLPEENDDDDELFSFLEEM